LCDGLLAASRISVQACIGSRKDELSNQETEMTETIETQSEAHTSTNASTSTTPPDGTPTETALARMRECQFWHSRDLHVVHGEAGDDGRANLQTNPVLVFSLLVNRSQPRMRSVSMSDREILCVSNTQGPRVYITDGRQRGLGEGYRNSENPSAIDLINRRTRMLCDLARDIAVDRKDAEAFAKPEVLKIRVRNEAINKQKRGEPGWDWATSAMLAPYIGGGIGGTGEGSFQIEGLIVWEAFVSDLATGTETGAVAGGPIPITYVAWVAHEPEARDPGTMLTQLGSLALKGAQVQTPPTVLARQVSALCSPRPPARGEGESVEVYAARTRSGGPYGQGIPVAFVASQIGYDSRTIDLHLRILDLIPEVGEALDAFARGEPGLSIRQVRDGGFFLSNTGGAGNVRIPKSPNEQRRLLVEHRGKRGVSSSPLGTDLGDHSADAPTNGLSGSPANASGSSGAGGAVASRDPDEVRPSDLAPRHRPDEARAPVGPDSPTTAGEPSRPARLGSDLFLALRERFSVLCEEVSPGRDGRLPDGGEPGADERELFRQYDAVYHALAYLAGDPDGLAADPSGSPIVNRFRVSSQDAIEEVLRSRGMTSQKTIGVVTIGTAVLPARDRVPASMIVTPRADDVPKVPTVVMSPDVAVAASAPTSAIPNATPSAAPKAAVKPRKAARHGKTPRTLAASKSPVTKIVKPAKAAQPAKPAKVAAKAKSSKPTKAPKASIVSKPKAGASAKKSGSGSKISKSTKTGKRAS
jgi:hypothetical protein